VGGVKVGGVKVLVRPLQHLVAFRAVRPGEDFLEFREAVDATAVLRRAGAFTGDARRVGLAVPGFRGLRSTISRGTVKGCGI
jgi:hypothetical protein